MNCERSDYLLNSLNEFDSKWELIEIARFEAIKAHMNRYLHEWSRIESKGKIPAAPTKALFDEMVKIRDLFPHIMDGKIFEVAKANPELYGEAVDEYEDPDNGETRMSLCDTECVYLACKRYVELYEQHSSTQPNLQKLRQLKRDLHVFTDSDAHDWDYPGDGGFYGDGENDE